MNCWAEKYVHQEAGKTLEKNCLAFVRRIVREEFRKDFPGPLGFARFVMRLTGVTDLSEIMLAAQYGAGDKRWTFRKTKRLKDGTVVIFGTDSNPLKHIGVYCQAADRIVHAVTDIERPIVRAEEPWRLRLEWPLILKMDVVPA